MTTTTSILLTALLCAVVSLCIPTQRLPLRAASTVHVVFSVSLVAAFVSVIAKFWGV